MKERLSNDRETMRRCRAIAENYQRIIEQVEKAAVRSGRSPEEITVLAATKTVDPVYINHAIDLGITTIGENRVQELLLKYDQIHRDRLSACHFIGHLQTNKVRQIVGKVDMIQSVDSMRLAEEISKRSVQIGMRTDILLEVNVGNEMSKSGFSADEIVEKAHQISTFEGVKVKGIMSIPPICSDNAQIRAFFKLLYKLFIDIKAEKIDNSTIDFISMGMSSDFSIAIEEGANIVRIGSALFGARME